MPVMPDLSVLLVAGRFLLILYATAATVLTTACLTLHALAFVDKLAARRRSRGGSPAATSGVRARRSLFVRIGPEPASEI